MAQKKSVDSPLEAATDKGYLGTKVDPTPDSHYSVSGVLAGKKTPETAEPGSPGATKGDPEAVTTGAGEPLVEPKKS